LIEHLYFIVFYNRDRKEKYEVVQFYFKAAFTWTTIRQFDKH